MEHRGTAFGVRKGLWTEEEDDLLRKCIEKYGEGKWQQVPSRAGLNRCRKSCRLRWLNYLRPNLKRGQFIQDEVDLIIRMHKLLGNRWALIAGRLPGRTGNDVKNYWNSQLNKRFVSKKVELVGRNENINSTRSRIMETNEIIKPHPLTFSENSQWLIRNNHSSMETTTATVTTTTTNGDGEMLMSKSSSSSSGADLDGRDETMVWLESILLEKEEEEEKITTGVADEEMELGNGKEQVKSCVEGNYFWKLLLSADPTRVVDVTMD